jgi:hypothetical protein
MPAGFYKQGVLQPYSVETWADLTAGWDTYDDTWNLTPSLPLVYNTAIVDAGRIDLWMPLTDVATNEQITTTIYYGDTVDSTGGAIDSESSVTYNVGDSVEAIKARYFRFEFSVGYADSAGVGNRPIISAIKTDLASDKALATFDSIDSSTLSGSVGVRELVVDQPISPTSLTVTPHVPPAPTYVADSYVASDDSAGELYTEVGTAIRPIIYIDKTSSPIKLYIYNFDTYGKNTAVDCTFDAMVQGIPKATVDDIGNIRR